MDATITLPGSASLGDLQAYARNPNLLLDITRVPPRVLKEWRRTAGSLRTDAALIEIPAMTHIGGSVLCSRPTAVVIPNLQSIGWSQWCIGADELRQDQLQHIGNDNGCTAVNRVYQPMLRDVGGLNACQCSAEVIQPLLSPQPSMPSPRRYRF